MITQSQETPIIIQNNGGGASGVASFVLGLLSIFFLAPIFVPLAFLLGIIAVFNRQAVWGILGLICASIGFVTSPILLGLVAITSLASHQPAPYNPPALQPASIVQPSMSSYAERLKTASEETVAVITECRNERLAGKLKTHVASANCSNPLIVDAYQRAGYQNMDLIGQLVAKRLELAEKIDTGKVTESEAQLENAQFLTHLTDLERQRNAAAR